MLCTIGGIVFLLDLSHRQGFVRHYYNDETRRENVTDGRTRRLAGGAVRGQPDPLEGGGLQDARLRLSRSDTSEVENLSGWLTRVVARVCLDMLRSRKSRREESLDVHVPEPFVSREDGIDPEYEALLADSVGLALLAVLETLTPAERLAFVLHDMFAVPFEEIAP